MHACAHTVQAVAMAMSGTTTVGTNMWLLAPALLATCADKVGIAVIQPTLPFYLESMDLTEDEVELWFGTCYAVSPHVLHHVIACTICASNTTCLAYT